MTDRDLPGVGLGPEELPDPDQNHAPLAQAIAAVQRADDITRARHLRTALEAMQTVQTVQSANATTSKAAIAATVLATRSRQRGRFSNPITAVAAAALLLFGLGAVVSLSSSNGSGDTELNSLEASAQTYVIEANTGPTDADHQPAESEMSARHTETMMVAQTPCIEEIERALKAEGPLWTWTADEVIEDGATVTKVEAVKVEALSTPSTSATDPGAVPKVTLILDPVDCRVLRIERAAPPSNR